MILKIDYLTTSNYLTTTNLSLAVYNLSLGLGLLLLLLVSLDAVEELLATARVLHVLHANVDPLRKDSLPATDIPQHNSLHTPTAAASIIIQISHNINL